jgi:hypothetical protein
VDFLGLYDHLYAKIWLVSTKFESWKKQVKTQKITILKMAKPFCIVYKLHLYFSFLKLDSSQFLQPLSLFV